MKRRLRTVIVGVVATNPYAGMAWMHMQIAAGLKRLGHDVLYVEIASNWPFDPIRDQVVEDSNYALPYLERITELFGIDQWAYRRGYSDRAWFGPGADKAEEWLVSADAVINVSGATSFREENLKGGNLIHLGTDPVEPEVNYENQDACTRQVIDEHRASVTYGENIGTPVSPLPPLPHMLGHTRQPILVDLWNAGPPTRPEFTTVCNWKSDGEVQFRGETYYWSKDREFLKFIDLPHRTSQPLELAMGLKYLPSDVAQLLATNGWKTTDAHAITLDPQPYREYIQASRGEFTVAKDQNVRLKSGWFSERSACYLAAGRPVVTQDTGFGQVLPTGLGLFSFNTMEEILGAFDAINSDYDRHAKAAREIADQYFRAETVLPRLLESLKL